MKRRSFHDEKVFQQPGSEITKFPNAEPNALGIIKRMKLHERALVRCLMEFGLKEWEDRQNSGRLSVV